MTFTTCSMKNHWVVLNLASTSFMEKGKIHFLPSPQFNSWFFRLLTSVVFFPAWEVLTPLVNSLHQSCSVSLIILVALNWALSSTIPLGRRRGLHIAFKTWMQAAFTQYCDNLFWFTLYSSSSKSQQLLVWLLLNVDTILRPHSWMVMTCLASITLYGAVLLSSWLSGSYPDK